MNKAICVLLLLASVAHAAVPKKAPKKPAAPPVKAQVRYEPLQHDPKPLKFEFDLAEAKNRASSSGLVFNNDQFCPWNGFYGYNYLNCSILSFDKTDCASIMFNLTLLKNQVPEWGKHFQTMTKCSDELKDEYEKTLLIPKGKDKIIIQKEGFRICFIARDNAPEFQKDYTREYTVFIIPDIERPWIGKEGKEVMAKYVSQDKASVVLNVKGKEYKRPFKALDEKDKKFLAVLKHFEQ